MSLALALTLPAASLNCAYAVFVPFPPRSVQLFAVAYVSHALHVALSLLKRICVTPTLSVADTESETAVAFVHAAPALTTTEPTGAAVSAGAVM